ncbi:hypothetical protein Ancab_038908 [Ancistrocladus abbreviatus]
MDAYCDVLILILVEMVLNGLDSAMSCVEDMNEWLGIFNVKLRHMREDIESGEMTMSDEMDLLVEQVKMLAGDIALSTSTIKNLLEQSVNDPDALKTQVQVPLIFNSWFMLMCVVQFQITDNQAFNGLIGIVDINLKISLL